MKRCYVCGLMFKPILASQKMCLECRDKWIYDRNGIKRMPRALRS